MPKKVTVQKLLERIKNKDKLAKGGFIKAITYLDFDRILEIEFKTFNPEKYDELMEKAQYMISDTRDIDQLDYLKKILPLSEIDRADDTPGRIKEYTGVSHHIWFTDMSKTPRDIVIYKSGKFIKGKYYPTRDRENIDDENSFVDSILNLSNGAKKSKLPLSENNFYHIIWTNYSKEDLIKHPEMSNMRKICGIDQSKVELPNFIVLNIEDVMDAKDIDEIRDLSGKKLPTVISKGLSQVKQDLLSVRNELDEMKEKKMFASMSDVIRIAAVKDIGGIYFDIDQTIFDQEKVHSEQKKYNLFDLMKNYECILGREGESSPYLGNCFISSNLAKNHNIEEIWYTIQRNITDSDKVEYTKYTDNGFSKVICTTGPCPFTLSVIKQISKNDLVLKVGTLMQPAYSKKLDDEIGILGSTIWSGTWIEDAKDLSNDYLYYDLETGKGITAAEWHEMTGLQP